MARIWRCYENGCRAPLGSIVRGELVLSKDSDNIQTINTEGAFLNVTCAVCGRVNRWIPKDSDLVKAVMNTHLLRELVHQVSHLWARGMNDELYEPEDIDDDED